MNRTHLMTFAALLLGAPVSPAAITLAGDVMFTGYNADGTDDLAFVLLADYDAGTVIHFTDNEWTGTAWADGNETHWSWSSAVNLTAGTLITLGNIGSGTLTTNTGSAQFNNGTGRGLGASNEAVYAYLGATWDTAAPVFLSAIANSGFTSASTGLLTGTGLTAGSTAVAFTLGQDVLAYNGDRASQVGFAAYGPLVADTANWLTEDGAGDQHNNGIGPDVPFNATAFAVVPEPSSALLACAAMMPLLRRRRA